MEFIWDEYKFNAAGKINMHMLLFHFLVMSSEERDFHVMQKISSINQLIAASWWRHRSGSTQVMAWFLMAPRHYLTQCWLIPWLSAEVLSCDDLKIPINETRLNLHFCFKQPPDFPGTNESCISPFNINIFIATWKCNYSKVYGSPGSNTYSRCIGTVH